MVNLIVAFNKSFGIGYRNGIPWHIPEDLERFKHLTMGGIVVMGYKTWQSLPVKPLPKRMNIVMCNDTAPYTCPPINEQIEADTHKHVFFMTKRDVKIMLNMELKREVWIIGGVQLFEEFSAIADKIYVTLVDNDDACDRFFPTSFFHMFNLTSASDAMESRGAAGTRYRYLVYEKNIQSRHCEFQYLHCLRNVMLERANREDRTGTGTKSVFAPDPLRFDLQDGTLPLLTTKFVSFKAILLELLWFLKGSTDSRVLEEQGINIWKGNTSRQFLDDRGLVDLVEGDIGPMYGFVWRAAHAQYRGCRNGDYIGRGIDQLTALVTQLQTDPYSRRHLLTTYIPEYVDQGCLVPCHGLVTQFYVSDARKEGKDQKLLSCHVYCRSQDLFLGQPFNIASYALLTHIIAKKCGMCAKELILSMGDAHVYTSHVKQVWTQLERTPYPFPIVKLSDAVATKPFEALDKSDFELIGYLHHASIRAPMAV